MNHPGETRPETAIEMFFDGACPLCKREVDLIRRRDHDQKIVFTDISAPDFEAEALGKSHDELMAEIHGRLPDGTWLRGVEVFRRVYEAIGFRSLVRLSRLPGISLALDVGYGLFARNRLRLTGRCDSTSESCELSSSSSSGAARSPLEPEKNHV